MGGPGRHTGKNATQRHTDAKLAAGVIKTLPKRRVGRPTNWERAERGKAEAAALEMMVARRKPLSMAAAVAMGMTEYTDRYAKLRADCGVLREPDVEVMLQCRRDTCVGTFDTCAWRLDFIKAMNKQGIVDYNDVSEVIEKNQSQKYTECAYWRERERGVFLDIAEQPGVVVWREDGSEGPDYALVRLLAAARARREALQWLHKLNGGIEREIEQMAEAGALSSGAGAGGAISCAKQIEKVTQQIIHLTKQLALDRSSRTRLKLVEVSGESMQVEFMRRAAAARAEADAAAAIECASVTNVSEVVEAEVESEVESNGDEGDEGANI
jgi:hypothetical protein